MKTYIGIIYIYIYLIKTVFTTPCAGPHKVLNKRALFEDAAN